MRSLLPIDELNVLKAYLTIDMVNKTKQEVIDSVLDILILAYVYGNNDANEMLETDISSDADEMRKTIYKKVAGKTFEERVSDYYLDGDAEGIIKVADTEMTRIYNESEMYVGNSVKGKTVLKKWNAILDDRTRETHFFLDGTTVPLNDYFYSISGDRALAPGGFSTADENCNCRCVLDLVTA